MSLDGELRAEAEEIRGRLIDLMATARAVDDALRDVVNLQASLKSAIRLSLDHLDKIDARLRKR